ncbi:MAG: HEAT repeat domain-containing protein [Planctomycetota bacterium]
MKAKRYLCFIMALAAIALSHCEMTGQAFNDPNPRIRRQAILDMAATGEAGAEALAPMLNDKDLVVRRTAARKLTDMGQAAMPALVEALKNDDLVVRRIAVIALGRVGGDAAPHLAGALKDKEPVVRQSAVVALASIRPSTEEILKLLEDATKDEDARVQEAARSAVNNFFEVVEGIRLPADNWAFQTDPQDKGRTEGWFKPDLDDKGWKRIRVETAWENQGIQHDGVAWYRRTVDLPKKPDRPRAVLHFGAVDECTWLWVNGEYAGTHDMGPSGWDKPFQIDVTGLVRWGEPNQIAVRVHDSAMAGGIWQPVELRVLKLRE